MTSFSRRDVLGHGGVAPTRDAAFLLRLRVPGWAVEKTRVAVNGERVRAPVRAGSFFGINRTGRPDAQGTIDVDRSPRLEPLNAAHPEIAALLTAPLVVRRPSPQAVHGHRGRDVPALQPGPGMSDRRRRSPFGLTSTDTRRRNPRHTRQGAIPTLALVAAVAGALPRRGDAQQYVTDDAAVTPDRACQIQMWFGQRASTVLPVCTPLHHVELSLGFIAVRRDASGGGHFEYVVQGKTLLRPLTPGGWGVGLVAGAGRDPALAGTNPDVRSYYVYAPVSRVLGAGRVVLHENTGWLYQRTGAQRAFYGQHALTWAARGDVALGSVTRPPVVAVVEAYGAAGAARAAAEFQAGLRAFPRRDAVQVDVSYGGYLQSGRRAAGWTLGLTLTPPPFL